MDHRTALLNIVKSLMCELLSLALEGIQPTSKHVPPRVPRFSIYTVWGRTSHGLSLSKTIKKGRTHLETGLRGPKLGQGGLYGSHVTTRSYDDKLL